MCTSVHEAFRLVAFAGALAVSFLASWGAMPRTPPSRPAASSGESDDLAVNTRVGKRLLPVGFVNVLEDKSVRTAKDKVMKLMEADKNAKPLTTDDAIDFTIVAPRRS